jgi:hypothetical protein
VPVAQILQNPPFKQWFFDVKNEKENVNSMHHKNYTTNLQISITYSASLEKNGMA